jgi:CrcB protein
MKKYTLITIFAIAGAICRYVIGLMMNGAFPWGTLTVNLVGCFLLPAFFILMKETGWISGEMITAIGTGFIGAFTTFSAFSLDVIKLLDQREWVNAVLYLSVSLAGGLFMAYLSVTLCTFIIRKYLKKEESK